MRRLPSTWLGILFVVVTAHLAPLFLSADPSDRQTVWPQDQTSPPVTTTESAATGVEEARERAKILHEIFHGTLQVIHRDYFRDDEGLKIPSRSMEDVFAQLAEKFGIQAKWIAVDLKAMSVHNEPITDFEKEAARELQAGKSEFETVTADRFHYAAKIQLSAHCLSCHASRRANNDERSAGLVLSLPLSQ